MADFNLPGYAEAQVQRLMTMKAFQAYFAGRDSGFAKKGRRKAEDKIRRELESHGITGEWREQIIMDIWQLLCLEMRAEEPESAS